MICRVEGCRRERQRDSLFCPPHTNDAWLNRLPLWRRRVEDPEGTGATLGLTGKDLTGEAAA